MEIIWTGGSMQDECFLVFLRIGSFRLEMQPVKVRSLHFLNKEELKRAERLARHTEFLELAALPEFQDQFVDELEFPEI